MPNPSMIVFYPQTQSTPFVLFKYRTKNNYLARQVLQMTADGFTSWEISAKLGVSESSVHSMLMVMRKCNNCVNTVSLVVKALREGLIV